MMKSKHLYELIWLSRPLMQAAEAAVEAGLKDSGLTVRTRAVLEILYTDGDMTVPDIAQKLEIKRQYVQLMVNEAFADGLTSKSDNPRHKRSTLVALTDNGRRLIEEVVQREKALVESIGVEMLAADIETALELVSSLTAKLKLAAGKL